MARLLAAALRARGPEVVLDRPRSLGSVVGARRARYPAGGRTPGAETAGSAAQSDNVV